VILLDTHVWVRWLAPSAQPLPPEVQARISSADQLAVSAICCWEVVQLQRRGRISLDMETPRWFDLALGGSGVVCLPVTGQIAARAAALTDIHRDPADRFIIATALTVQAPLLTLDENVRRYPELQLLLA